MNNDKQQQAEAKLRNEIHSFIKEVDFDTSDDMVHSNSGNIMYVTYMLERFAISQHAKEYWESQRQKVDIDVSAVINELMNNHLKHGFDLESFKAKQIKFIEIAFQQGANCMYNKLLPHLQPAESDAIPFNEYLNNNYCRTIFGYYKPSEDTFNMGFGETEQNYISIEVIYAEFKKSK